MLVFSAVASAVGLRAAFRLVSNQDQLSGYISLIRIIGANHYKSRIIPKQHISVRFWVDLLQADLKNASVCAH